MQLIKKAAKTTRRLRRIYNGYCSSSLFACVYRSSQYPAILNEQSRSIKNIDDGKIIILHSAYMQQLILADDSSISSLGEPITGRNLVYFSAHRKIAGHVMMAIIDGEKNHELTISACLWITFSDVCNYKQKSSFQRVEIVSQHNTISVRVIPSSLNGQQA